MIMAREKTTSTKGLLAFGEQGMPVDLVESEWNARKSRDEGRRGTCLGIWLSLHNHHHQLELS